MADMLTPLHWDDRRAPRRNDPSDGGPESFRWPTPPFACYPEPTPQTDPIACEIVGMNASRTAGRLTFFVPDEGVAHVQVPPSRTTLPLRFEQFRSITLTPPLEASTLRSGDPHADMLAQRPVGPYRIVLRNGTELRGETIGHVETDHGLFLFPPQDDVGAVRRMFIPRAAYAEADVGQRIGDVLVDQQAATQAQVDQAAALQAELRRQKLGDILLTRQVVTPEQLFAALDRQASMPLVRIGEALTSLGLVTQDQLDQALDQQRRDRTVPLGELLVRAGVVSREDLQSALARKMGYPLVDVDAFPVEADALRRLAYNTAARLRVMPLLVRDGRLVAAIDDPVRRRAAVEEVEFATQMKVVPVLADAASIDKMLFAAYDRIGAAQGERITFEEVSTGLELEAIGTDQLVETLEREQNDRDGGAPDDAPIEQSDNSLVRLINNMIVEAHKQGVSDIHIESYPGREKIRVRFRKDGLLQTYLELPSNYRSALIARVKIMCDLDISERRKPQDGKINFARFSPQHKIELRVASIPTNNGLEDVVMRILASAKPLPLDRLGLASRNLTNLKLSIERPYGMVLCVGPTGSGKTTTLHSVLSHINVPERKIWTAEDPIEITQPGLRQVQVNPKIEWTFAKALRAFLRADPDVIMVGEIRDEETAHMAIEASLTGHLVLSTLHTNSAPETVTRLLDMGMDPFNFADALLGVLAQRLVRRICTHCRTSHDATEDEVDELVGNYLYAFTVPDHRPDPEQLKAEWRAGFGREGRLQAYHAPGCDKCDGTGFKGRAGLHELMSVSRDLRHLIQTGARANDLQQLALAEGMRTLRQDGIEKVLAGVTTIEEVRATSNA